VAVFANAYRGGGEPGIGFCGMGGNTVRSAVCAWKNWSPSLDFDWWVVVGLQDEVPISDDVRENVESMLDEMLWEDVDLSELNLKSNWDHGCACGTGGCGCACDCVRPWKVCCFGNAGVGRARSGIVDTRGEARPRTTAEHDRRSSRSVVGDSALMTSRSGVLHRLSLKFGVEGVFYIRKVI